MATDTLHKSVVATVYGILAGGDPSPRMEQAARLIADVLLVSPGPVALVLEDLERERDTAREAWSKLSFACGEQWQRADTAEAENSTLRDLVKQIEALRSLSEAAAPGDWSVSGIRRSVNEVSCVIIDAPSCPVLLALPTGDGAQALEALRDARFAVAAVNLVRALLNSKDVPDV